MARHQVIVRDKFKTSSRNGNMINSRYDSRVIKISPQAQQLRQSWLDYCYLGRECDVFNAAKYPDISENPIYHRFKGPCLASRGGRLVNSYKYQPIRALLLVSCDILIKQELYLLSNQNVLPPDYSQCSDWLILVPVYYPPFPKSDSDSQRIAMPALK